MARLDLNGVVLDARRHEPLGAAVVLYKVDGARLGPGHLPALGQNAAK